MKIVKEKTNILKNNDSLVLSEMATSSYFKTLLFPLPGTGRELNGYTKNICIPTSALYFFSKKLLFFLFIINFLFNFFNINFRHLQTQQSVQNYAPADAMVGFPSSQQQQPQHYVPSPLPPPINTATMFPVNDQQQQMIGHRLFMDNQLVNQQQQQLAEEQQQQHSAGGGTGGTFRLHQANVSID